MIASRMRSCFTLAWLALAPFALGQSELAHMLVEPDIHGDQVVFCSEGDVWLGDLKTQTAVRLTTWPGNETRPRFSPDGKSVLFSGQYDGRRDAYVVPVTGGEPIRWTWDKSGAEPLEWAPDGRSIYIRSGRGHAFRSDRIFQVFAPGQMPTLIPIERAGNLAIDGNGNLIYTKFAERSNNWGRYRGGMQNDLMRFQPGQPQDLALTKSEFDENSPAYCDGYLYYVSESTGKNTLHRVDDGGKRTEVVLASPGASIAAPASDGTRVIYQKGAGLEIYDPKTKATRPTAFRLVSDRIHARPYTVRGTVGEFALGPTGKRIVLESRGQLFSAPTTQGDIRALPHKPGARKKFPAYKPDGTSIAFLSDENDEWNIWVQSADLISPPEPLTQWSKRVISGIQWSPNGKYLLALYESGELLHIDAESGATKVIANGSHSGILDVDISASGNLVAYTMPENFGVASAYVYEVNSGKTTRLTFRPHQDIEVAFDRNGRVLYVSGNRNVNMAWDSFDFQMNSSNPTRILAFYLTSDPIFPLMDRVDEEPNGPAKGPSDAEEAAFTLDIAGAPNRYSVLPVPPGEYRRLQGMNGAVTFLDGGDLKRFSMQSKKLDTLASGVSEYEFSPKRDRIALRVGGELKVGEPNSAGAATTVPTGGWTVPVNPKAEWRQILREGWRHIRDNFYDPKLHGADWDAVWREAEAQLPAVGDRQELQRLIGQMQAHVKVSHMYNGGGTNRFTSPGAPASMGFLGADMQYVNGYLKVTKVYRGDGFDPGDRSPLASPEVNLKDGDLILAINGVPMRDGLDPQKVLTEQGGKFVKLDFNSTPSLEGMRGVFVRTMTSEDQARYIQWTQDSAKFVTSRAPNFGYVHIPAMGEEGMAQFTKSFYADLDRDGLIIDVRDNGGGITSGLVLERLRRVIFEYDQGRHGAPVPYHRMGFLPRIVVLCNETTASDGEYFCTGFRQMKLGPTVGMRTWGGFAAVGFMGTIDGGFISSPVQGSFSPDGKWLPDGYGFAPDVTVPMGRSYAGDPKDDTQLVRAIAVLQDLVRKDPVKRPKRMVPPIKD